MNFKSKLLWREPFGAVIDLSKRRRIGKSRRVAGCLGLAMTSLVLGGCPGTGSTGPTTYERFYLYTANRDSNDVSMFESDSSGRLTFFGKVPVGTAPTKIVTSENYAFVGNGGDNSISVFRILSSGMLQFAGSVSTGSTPSAMATLKSLDRSVILDVACAGSNQVIAYKLTDLGGSTPILTEIARASVGSGASSIDMGWKPGATTMQVIVSNFSDGTLSLLEQTTSGFLPVSSPTLTVAPGPIGVTDFFSGGGMLPSFHVFSFGSSAIQSYSGSTSAGLTLFRTTPTTGKPIACVESGVGEDVYLATTGPTMLQHFKATSTSSELKVVGSGPIVGGAPTAMALKVLARGGTYVTTDDGWLGIYRSNADSSLLDRVDTHGVMPVSVATTLAGFVATETTPLVITSNTLSNGSVGTAYEAAIATVGGRAGQPINWSVTSGSLPPGLSLTSSGSTESLSGNPTTAGTYTFTVQGIQGVTTVSKTFTVTISGGAGGPGNVRFMNASTVTAFNPLVLKLGTTSFGSVAYGSISGSQTITTGGISFSLNLPGGASQISGSTVVDDPNRNIFVSLGAISSDLLLSKFSFAASYPGSTKAGVSFMNGIPTRDLPSVDVYIYGGATLFKQQLAVTYGGVVTCALPPGTYFVKVTEPGNPAAVIASSLPQGVAAGENALDVVVSPESAAATFVQAKE